MVRVPTPAGQGAQQLGVVQPIAQRDPAVPNLAAGVRAAWAPFIQLAGGVAELGAQLQKQENDRDLLEVQNRYAEAERDLMFGENGWVSQTGSSAFGLTDRAEAELEAWESAALGDVQMSGAAQRAAMQWLSGQKNSALAKVAAHEFKERESHNIVQRQANVDNLLNSAASYYNNPAEMERRLGLALQAQDDMLRRRGIDPDSEVGKAEELKLTTSLTETAATNAWAAGQARRALGIVEAAARDGRIDAQSAATLRNRYSAEADSEAGRAFAQAAFTGASTSPGDPAGRSGAWNAEMFWGSLEAPGSQFVAEGSRGDPFIMSPTNDLGIAQLNVAIRSPADSSKRGHFGYGVWIDVDRYESGDKEYQLQVAKDMMNALYSHASSPTRGDWIMSLAAYNWGPGNVQNWKRAGYPLSGPGSIPSTTVNYIRKITGVDITRPAARTVPAEGTQVAQAAPAVTATDSSPVPTSSAETWQHILAMPNQRQRDAAIRELSQLQRIDAQQRTEQERALTLEISQFIEEGGTVEAWKRANPDKANFMAPHMNTFRAYEERYSAFTTQADRDTVWSSFYQMQETIPGRQALIDMSEPELMRMFGNAGQDYTKIRAAISTIRQQHLSNRIAAEKEAAEAPTRPGNVYTLSTAHSDSKRYATGIGIDLKKDENKATVARAAQDIALEHDEFLRENGRPMTLLEKQQAIARRLRQDIEIDGPLFGFDTTEATFDDLRSTITRALDDDRSFEDDFEIRIPQMGSLGADDAGELDGATLDRLVRRLRRENPDITNDEIAEDLVLMLQGVYGFR